VHIDAKEFLASSEFRFCPLFERVVATSAAVAQADVEKTIGAEMPSMAAVVVSWRPSGRP